MRRARALFPLVLLALAACSGDSVATSADAGEREDREKIAQMSTAPFACGVEYTVENTLQDDLMASYGMGTYVDTTRVCGTWTGSDYRVHVQTLGSTDAGSETADPITVATYDAGVTTGQDVTGAAAGDPAGVGSDAFVFGQASANEQQASYNEPYYGVTSGGGGDGGTCIIDCAMYGVVGGAAANSRPMNPRAAEVRTKQHGVRRAAVRALLGDKDEIGRGANGHRRFRRIDGEVQHIIEVDPATDLISAEETRTPRGVARATLTWRKDERNDRWVRDRLEVETSERVNGLELRSRATVRILNLVMGGQ